MVFITYFRFIFINLAKKWSTWVFAILYMAFIFTFVYIVPSVTKTNPWSLWQNTLVAPQMMLMYVAAIYGAIISISIFKDYRDNGTELLLVSKPIARGKIIVAKFLLLIVFNIVFSLVACLIGFITFSMPDTTPFLCFSFMFSIFISTFLVTFILSVFATIISLFANKVWTVLITIVLVVLFTILSTVSNLAIKSPAGLATDEGHAIISSNYLGRDGKEYSVGALSPFSSANGTTEINFSNIDEERAYWQKYQDKSEVKLVNAIDVMGQFQNLNNMLGLQEIQQETASSFFGENHWFNYELDNQAIVDHKDNEPMFYVQMPSTGNNDAQIILDDIKGLDQFVGDEGEENFSRVFNAIMSLLTNEKIVMIGETSAKVSSVLTPLTLKSFHVVENHNGWMGAQNNLEDKNYDDVAVAPYSGGIKDKLFRAMLNAQLGIKQKPITTPDDEYQFDYVDDQETHIKNTCNYWDDLEKYIEFKDTSADDPDNPNTGAELNSKLGNLFSPRINTNASEKITEDDDSYKNLFGSFSYNSCFAGNLNIPMDFPHFCFVGANNGIVGDSPFYIYDPDSLDDPEPTTLQLQGQLIPDLNDTNESNKELMDLMSQYKLFAFEYLTNIIKRSEINGDIYQAAYNTKLKIDGEDLGYDFNLDFNSSPILPIQVNDQDKYSYLNDFWNDFPVADIGELMGFLYVVCPNLFHDELIQYFLITNGMEWHNNWGNPYFSEPAVLNARALLDWFVSTQKYGWESATDPLNFNLIQSYVTNIVTNANSNNVNNFPIVYENLSAPFTTKIYYEIWEIAIIWFTIGIILSAAAILIYMRSDFK